MTDYYGGGGGAAAATAGATSSHPPHQKKAVVNTIVGQSTPGSSLAHSDEAKIFVGMSIVG